MKFLIFRSRKKVVTLAIVQQATLEMVKLVLTSTSVVPKLTRVHHLQFVQTQLVRLSVRV